MKAQPPGVCLLSALLLVCVATQTAVAATHATLLVHPGAAHERPADGEERGGHDPASCSFCRVAPAGGHALVASVLALPIDAGAIRRSVDAVPAPPRPAPWVRPASRAPPVSPIS